MTEEYKFFNSTEADLREYEAGDFANYFGSIYTSGLLFEDNNLALQVTTNGALTTKVGSGKALIKGHSYENTSPLVMVHNPSTGGRIDRIVLRMDLGFDKRYIKLFVKEGTASSPPSLTRTEQVYELSLARVKVRAGATSITASDITDERLDETVCGPVTAMVSAMAFSYPSDVPSNITSILNKVNSMESTINLLKSKLSGANPFDAVVSEIGGFDKNKRPEGKYLYKEIKGKFMLEDVTMAIPVDVDLAGQSSYPEALGALKIDGYVFTTTPVEYTTTTGKVATIKFDKLYVNEILRITYSHVGEASEKMFFTYAKRYDWT